MENVIWSNEIDVIEQIEKDMLEHKGEEGYPLNIDEYNSWAGAVETNNEYLEDERANLNIEVGDEIIIIADLGLWNGRKMAYKLLRKTNIADCLAGTCGDYVTWFVDDRGDLCCRDKHHDGTNMYLYRAWKAGITETQKENFCEKVYTGKATRKDITKYTRRLGEYIADVYGWKIRGRR